MKKTYFDVTQAKFVAIDGHVRSVRHRSPDFKSRCYKTDASGKEIPEDEDDKRTEEELLKKIETRISKSLEGTATKEELEAIRAAQKKQLEGMPLEALRSMADDKTGVMATLAKQGLEIQRLETRITKGEEMPKDMSFRGQIKSWLEQRATKDPNDQTTVADLVKDIRNGIKRDLPSLELRAVASPMHVSTVNAGGSPYIGKVEVEGGINDFLVFPNKFWETITKGRSSAPTYVWVNKATRDGAAAFIGPGVAKPGVSFTLEAETSIAKKIADSAKAGTELLQDIEGMMTFIETELKEQVFIKVNETLMTNAGSSTVPAGIQTYSVAYPAGVGIKTTNPTYMDAIRAVVGYLRSGKLTGDITVFVNSIDAANMDLSKANNSGVYLLPPFSTSNGQTIAGARIVEDQNIPVGSFQAAFLRYYRILIYKDFTVTWGWENDDFTKNLVTAVGEMRLHQFVNTIHSGFAVYDTFANVVDKITEA